MMKIKSFKEWLLQRESTAFTRSRRSAAQGLKPVTGNLASHSHSTAHPFELEVFKKKGKKKKKKKDE